ncbi:MAG TPA: carbohydrate ABC transporter permease, partial [Candidatus Eisenbergiella merdipullorum]|nr:carbohydrate ABC transporter permease [Candidatus Eisenbergiella merdipullorum]
WYTAFSVIITVVISILTGYVFARGEFPGKKIVFALFSSLMFISLGNITIYPIFDILNIVNLSTSLWGLIVMKFFGVGIVNIYLVRSYVWTLPRELDEAAAIDGCGFVRTFTLIIAPLLKPIIATLVILTFNTSWNDYLMPTLFTMSRPEQQTLMVAIVALKGSGQAAANWNLMLAGATIGLVPILVVYAFFNRYFVDGLAAGAVKG